MQHAPNSQWIRQHARHLPHATITVDRLELARIHERIPVRHVHHVRIILDTRVRKLRKEPPRVQVVVVLVDLSDCLADFQVCLEIIHPVALVAVNRDPAVRTLKVRMCRGLLRLLMMLMDMLCTLAVFRVMRGHGQSCLLVARVRAEGVLLDEGSSLSDRRRRGPRERVEEVVGLQEFPAFRGWSGRSWS